MAFGGKTVRGKQHCLFHRIRGPGVKVALQHTIKHDLHLAMVFVPLAHDPDAAAAEPNLYSTSCDSAVMDCIPV